LYNIILVESGFHCIGKTIVDLGLPNSIIIALVERNNKFFVSDGATTIYAGDKLYVMADDVSSVKKLYNCLGKPCEVKVN
jgi:cell volume regulation protein A